MVTDEVDRVHQFLARLREIEDAMAQSEELMGLADDTPIDVVAKVEHPVTTQLRMSEELRRVIRAHVREELEQKHRQMRETLGRLVRELDTVPRA